MAITQSVSARQAIDYMPTAQELDQLLAGEMAAEAYMNLSGERHVWMDHFFAALQCWKDRAVTALVTYDPEPGAAPNPDFAHDREIMLRLFDDVMAAYVPALRETSTFAADWMHHESATFELLKRYRLFTGYVELFTSES